MNEHSQGPVQSADHGFMVNNWKRRESNDSRFSQNDEDILEAGNRETMRKNIEAQASLQLDRARYKPVAFAVRTNIEYNGAWDDDSPVHGYAVSFHANSYLHVIEKYDHNWWIGRLVEEGRDFGFIPSPVKLESIKQQNAKAGKSKQSMQTPVNMDNLDKMMSKAGSRNSLPPTAAEDDVLPKSAAHPPKERKKTIFKKAETLQPYEVVPAMRPVVLIGPSLKGHEVTDLMQRALFQKLKEEFEGRIIITHVKSDISLAKRSVMNNPSKRPLLERANSRTSMAEIQSEIEKIFELARTMQLVVLDCDTINHPSQLSKTSLAPLHVYIKISSPKVLQRLIKDRGKKERKNINIQMVAAEKLAQCPQDLFDVILDDNQLDDACYKLVEFLEQYYRATHPEQRSPPRIKRNPMESRGPSAPFTPAQMMQGLSTHMSQVSMGGDSSHSGLHNRYSAVSLASMGSVNNGGMHPQSNRNSSINPNNGYLVPDQIAQRQMPPTPTITFNTQSNEHAPLVNGSSNGNGCTPSAGRYAGSLRNSVHSNGHSFDFYDEGEMKPAIDVKGTYRY